MTEIPDSAHAGDDDRTYVNQFQLEPLLNCNVAKPDGAPNRQISFTWQFLFPKK